MDCEPQEKSRSNIGHSLHPSIRQWMLYLYIPFCQSPFEDYYQRILILKNSWLPRLVGKESSGNEKFYTKKYNWCSSKFVCWVWEGKCLRIVCGKPSFHTTHLCLITSWFSLRGREPREFFPILFFPLILKLFYPNIIYFLLVVSHL